MPAKNELSSYEQWQRYKVEEAALICVAVSTLSPFISAISSHTFGMAEYSEVTIKTVVFMLGSVHLSSIIFQNRDLLNFINKYKRYLTQAREEGLVIPENSTKFICDYRDELIKLNEIR
jgi:hypothetical protein